MSPTAVVWLVVGLLTLLVTLAMLIALIRHVFVLGRAIGRFRDEVGPVARDIGEHSSRATSRAQRLKVSAARGDRR